MKPCLGKRCSSIVCLYANIVDLYIEQNNKYSRPTVTGLKVAKADGRRSRAKADGRRGRAKADARRSRAKANPRRGRAKADGRRGRAKADGRRGRAKANPRRGRAKADARRDKAGLVYGAMAKLIHGANREHKSNARHKQPHAPGISVF